MVGLITDIPNSLKIAYPDKAVETMVQEELVFRPRLSREIPAGSKLTDGYEIRFGARLSPAQNVAQIGDGANFPIPKDATDRQFIFKPTIFAGDYQIGLLTRFVANSNVAAFNGGEMRRRPEEVMSNLGKHIEQAYVGTAGDGIRGYVESDGVNTLVVKRPYQLDLLPENLYITVRQTPAGAVRDSLDLRQITDRNLDTRTLTYSGADQTAVANDPIYVTSETTQTLTSIFANGLRGQIDDGTNNDLIHTLSRSAAGNSKLKSPTSSNGGELRAWTEQIMLQLVHDTRKRSGKTPSTIVLGPGQVERYIDFVAPFRRFNVSPGQRQGKTLGYQMDDLKLDAPGVSFDFILSFDCLMREAYGLSWDCFFLYEAVRLQWLSGHDLGQLLLLPGSNGAAHKAAWGAYLVSVENFGTDFPLASCVWRDLKDRGDL